jgi:cyclopropane-fatty-acyl-phospholipid synthase
MRVARQHYDRSTELYVAMLGPTMQYTCAYFGVDGESMTLDEAQHRKLDLIARKLHLQPGMTVLELGGGFGGLALHLARHHQCRVVSYNISRDQVEFARAWCEGLPVEFRLQDYREAASDPVQYDRVVSIGLMEHVGPQNYRRFFQIVRARLAPGGLALVHTIGGHTSKATADRWIDRYIFPGGVIPSERQLAAAKEGLFVLED